ncbi:MAG: hypothetical protein PUB98_08975 [Clostridiales bacterium]|nr:hypothetical protein [Clostridiales bacterium]
MRVGSNLFLPYALRSTVTVIKSIKYIWRGICSALSGKMEVAILDGVAGLILPTTSALLHNASTLAISMDAMNGWKTDACKKNEGTLS